MGRAGARRGGRDEGAKSRCSVSDSEAWSLRSTGSRPEPVFACSSSCIPHAFQHTFRRIRITYLRPPLDPASPPDVWRAWGIQQRHSDARRLCLGPRRTGARLANTVVVSGEAYSFLLSAGLFGICERRDLPWLRHLSQGGKTAEGCAHTKLDTGMNWNGHDEVGTKVGCMHAKLWPATRRGGGGAPHRRLPTRW